MSLDGSNVELVIADGRAFQPRWSPSGEEIAYVSAVTSLHIIQADNMRSNLIKSAIVIRDPSWSPDGQIIALSYSNNDLVTEIFLMDAVTGETTPLTNSSDVETSPAWSPNGDWIVFVSDFKLFKARPDGSEIEQITDLDCSPNSPDWFAFES
jgi:TolB protein